jgi:hypothetical protein
MQSRYATARFVKFPSPLVIIKTACDYFELAVLNRIHAGQKLNQFVRANSLILTSCIGLPAGCVTPDTLDFYDSSPCFFKRK